MRNENALTHIDYHYSIRVNTDSLAVLHCLRGLAEFSERTSTKKIAWGGSKRTDWERDQHCVTFHFSDLAFRDVFRSTAQELLPRGSWSVVRERDDDPARPQG